MDFLTTIGFASSVITIAEKGKGIDVKLKNFVRKVLKGDYIIVIFGAGGNGKTSLAYTLNQEELDNLNYKETHNTEQLKMNSDIWGHFLVAPGQERRIERYWADLLTKISTGKIAGVINVVSYGYHSVDIGNKSFKDTSYFNADRIDNFLDDFLKEKRREEIRYLKKIAEHIKTAPNKVWMLTLVNKQDLWWNKQKEVENFYKNGEYNAIIEDIVSSRGTNHFLHEYISCSLFSCNFQIGSDFTKRTVEGYDEPLRRANYNNFVENLNSLLRNGE